MLKKKNGLIIIKRLTKNSGIANFIISTRVLFYSIKTTHNSRKERKREKKLI